jgi:uncharacterized membrane protein
MSEPAAVRQLTTTLAFAYPLLAHFAIARNSSTLTIAAIALLAILAFLPGMARGRLGAWLALLAAGAGCWWLAQASLPVLALYVPPVLVPAFLACIFGQTLLRGRTPLISQLIRALDPAPDELESAVWTYARHLTLAWTVLFIVLATCNLGLAAFAEPDGLLLAAGIRPPVAVPVTVWSLFTNLIEYLIVACFFVIEYAYRRRRFPRQPYRNMFEFLRRMLAALPRLIGRAP